jgi:hypothetical protein
MKYIGLYLNRFVDILNDHHGESIGALNKDGIFEGIQDAKIFVVKGYEDAVGEDHDSLKESPFSLPFKTCWFEVFDGGVVSMMEGRKMHVVRGILIEEVGPNFFNYAALIDILDKDGPTTSSVFAFHDGVTSIGKMGELANILKHGVRFIIDRINTTDAVGLSKTSDRVKMKTSKGKIIHKIKKIVYITPKKERDKAASDLGVEIEWSHRWLVRGHWRKFSGLGKDRAGNYCIKGHTWVTEHEKGPEELPLVEKVRVVSKTDTEDRPN